MSLSIGAAITCHKRRLKRVKTRLKRGTDLSSWRRVGIGSIYLSQGDSLFPSKSIGSFGPLQMRCLFVSTGEDHFLESKKPMCLRPRNEIAAVTVFAKNGAAEKEKAILFQV